MIDRPAVHWSDLGGGVLVRQSRAFHMNSVALLDPDHTLLVDPGVLPSEIDDMQAVVAAVAPRETTLVLTHAHWDHVLARAWWPDAAVLAHDAFAAELRADRAHIESERTGIAATHGETWRTPFSLFVPDQAVSGQRFLKLGDWRVVVRDAFGHCDSQLSLHLAEFGLLIAADMLSDVEIPALNRPAAVYRGTLEALRPLFEGGAIEILVPGHGTIAQGRAAAQARFERDITYLEALESGVRAAHARGADETDTLDALRSIPDVERHSDYPMHEIHDENVRLTYQGIAAATR